MSIENILRWIHVTNQFLNLTETPVFYRKLERLLEEMACGAKSGRYFSGLV